MFNVFSNLTLLLVRESNYNPSPIFICVAHTGRSNMGDEFKSTEGEALLRQDAKVRVHDTEPQR